MTPAARTAGAATDAPLRVLVAGARGVIGRALCPVLARAGHHVVEGVRPAFDVDDEGTMRAALVDVDVAVWLVHGLKHKRDYAIWETRTASAFASCASAAGVSRIVYLGGIDPRRATASAAISRHLASRLATGDALRRAGVPVIELRAAMIVGAGSESWLLARDGAARLPAFLAPPWLAARSQPVALDDVIAVLRAAVDGRVPAGSWDVPGPERLSGRAIVERTALLLGRRARFLPVPAFPRRLAAAVAPLVTRANGTIARELFGGVGFDLLVEGDGVFAHLPEHARLSFDDAVLCALADDDVPRAARLYESALRALGPSP